MNHLSTNPGKFKNGLLYFTCLGILFLAAGCRKGSDIPEPKLTISTLATGLAGPLGLEYDKHGNVWIAETGTGHNDGRVSVIKQNGQRYDAIVNFESIILEAGIAEGPGHLLFADGLLYITGPRGKLFKANVSSFQPGNTPIDASTLAVENIGDFVLAYPFVNNTHETHLYGITKGPGGAIYITDAGANAVIRRSPSGALSMVAEIPGIVNPLPFGPPFIQSVPTSIIYENGKFLVTAFLGFPFPEGKSIIYNLTPSGNVSIFQDGLTSLVDIAKGGQKGQLVVQHGVFGAMGWTPNTGKLIWANGTNAIELTTGLNLPSGITQTNSHTWYISSLGDNSVLKVTY
ncbi:MAG: ScyD/ScyE family protein [Ginsengibacter sp.]